MRDGKLFQIYDSDLADLERILPELLHDLAFSNPCPQVRAKFRRVRQIISDVRWNYGPPEQVEKIDP